MKPLTGSLALISFLVAGPLLTAAPQTPRDRTPPPAEAGPQEVRPDALAPRDLPPPPPPPAARPKPPAEAPQAQRERSQEDGQWVHTEQYGWVWMPYGDGFTHTPPSGGTPHMYLYYPEVGWTWVLAPWLWGWGPRPYFGVVGPRFYGWWGVGLGHWYGFSGRGHVGFVGGSYWGSGRWHHVGRGTYSPGHGSYGRGGNFSFGGGTGGGGGRSLSPGWRR